MKNNLKLFGIFLLSVTLFWACSKDDKPEKPPKPPRPKEEVSVKGYEKTTATDTVKMKTNVIYVKKDINEQFVGINREKKTITYKATEETTQVKIGDVLYSTGSEKYPDGYALKVKSVIKESNNVIYEYEQAEIGDVFDKIDEKQTYKVDGDGIKTFDIEAQRKALENSSSPSAYGVKSELEISKKRGKLKLTSDGVVEGSYVLVDADNNFKTKNDQLILDVKMNFKKMTFENKYKGTSFSANIVSDVKITTEFRYGAKSSVQLDSIIKPANEKLKKAIDKELGVFLGRKKITIGEVPLTGIAPTDIIVKPILKFELFLETNFKGEIAIKLEWTPTVKAGVKVGAFQVPQIKPIVGGKSNGTPNVSIIGKASVESKFGICVAIDFLFSAFVGEDEKGEYKPSKIGLNFDTFLGAKLKAKGKWDIAGKTTNRYLKGNVSGGLYCEPYLDIDFYLFKLTDGYHVSFKPDEPFKIIDVFDYSFGYFLMEPNSIEVLTMKNNSGDFENTSSKKDVARAEIEKEDVLIKALNIGETNIHVKDKKRFFKRADIRVGVTKNKDNKAPTTPVLIYPNDKQTIYQDNTVLSWEKSTDADNIVRYEIYMSEPVSEDASYTPNLDKIDDFVLKTTYKLDTLKEGMYYWNVIATDGQERISSKLFTFKISNQVNPPKLVAPTNGAKDVTLDVASVMKWELASYKNMSGEITYKLYFGEDKKPKFFQDIPSGVTSPQSSIKTTPNTTYYWRLEAFDVSGNFIATTDTWSFTTKQADLTLSTDNITLQKGKTATVTITSGSGNYTASSEDSNTATAELQDNTITIKGVAKGKTTVKVTDTETQQTAIIMVTVKANGSGTYPEDQKIFVKGGTFMMGSPEGEGGKSERPQHEVTVSDFYIGKYEVTNAQFAEFLNAKGNQSEGGATWLNLNNKYCQIEKVGDKFKAKSGKENYPVIMVTWYGARAYAQWVGGRLPTEAEWEYAARGGNKSKGYKYSGSNTIDDVAWYRSNTSGSSPNTQTVGTKAPNELGIFDMSGNVWEWCEDKWHSNYTDAPTDGTAWVDGNSSYRVFRGGSCSSYAKFCRVAYRFSSKPYNRYSDIGFRVAFVP